MERDTAHLLVNVIALLHAFGAVAGIILALALLVGMQSLPQLIAQVPIPAGMSADELLDLVRLLLAVLAVICIALATLDGLICVGLWRRRSWARVLALAFAWVGGILALFSLIAGIAIVVNIVWLLIAGIVVWLLEFCPEVAALFRNPDTTRRPRAKGTRARTA